MNKRKHAYKLVNIPKPAKFVVVLLLALISILTLFFLFLSLVGDRPSLIAGLDNLLSFLFLALFVYLYWLSNDRKTFIKKHWWLLLAAIPIDWLENREGVMLAIANILAVGRFSVRVTLLVRVSRRLIPKSFALIVTTTLAAIVLISTALFYSAEQALNPEVNTYFDSFWWAMVTGTTIGYGDIAPVTTTGRWVAIFLMVFGLGVFGFVTGSVASILSSRARKISSNNQD